MKQLLRASTLAFLGLGFVMVFSQTSLASNPTIHKTANFSTWNDDSLKIAASLPITGNRDDAVSNGRMNTSFSLTKNGQLTAVTNTRTKVKLAGFTGAVSIVFLDSRRQPIWVSDTHSYGVDGCVIGRCNRNDNWSQTVPTNVVGRIKGYAIIQQHNPTWLSRVGDKGDRFLRWLGSSEGRATVGTIATIAVML